MLRLVLSDYKEIDMCQQRDDVQVMEWDVLAQVSMRVAMRSKVHSIQRTQGCTIHESLITENVVKETETHSSKTSCQSYQVEIAIRGINNKGTITILESIAMTTVFVSPVLEAGFAAPPIELTELFLRLC